MRLRRKADWRYGGMLGQLSANTHLHSQGSVGWSSDYSKPRLPHRYMGGAADVSGELKRCLFFISF